MIRREVLLAHSEAVATLRVEVQFCRFMSACPSLVQGNAFRRESELIIGCSCNKHRRCVRWNGNIFRYFPAGIDRGYEGGPAFRQVMEGNSGSDPSTSGESDYANTVGGNSPFRGVLPNVGDCR
jgi:hypothetical protein